MKKYFVKGIEHEPLEYGDVIGVDLVKESDDKTKTIKRHVEVPFTPDTEDMLLALEVIEEKEVEEDKETDHIRIYLSGTAPTAIRRRTGCRA